MPLGLQLLGSAWQNLSGLVLWLQATLGGQRAWGVAQYHARRRVIIESIIDQLKNISQIEHSRHRLPVNSFVNVSCGLIAYCHQATNDIPAD